MSINATHLANNSVIIASFYHQTVFQKDEQDNDLYREPSAVIEILFQVDRKREGGGILILQLIVDFGQSNAHFRDYFRAKLMSYLHLQTIYKLYPFLQG